MSRFMATRYALPLILASKDKGVFIGSFVA